MSAPATGNAPLKGSWEDLLYQARALAAREDDAAIPLFQKLVDRLIALPTAQRAAADGRLEGVLVGAAIDLQYYFTLRDRYADALAINRRLAATLTGPARLAFDKHAAALTIQSGAVDAGFLSLCELAASGEIDLWGDALFAAQEHGRPDLADQAVRGAEAWVNRTYAGQLDSPDAKRDQAYVAFLKARRAVHRGLAAESMAWFEFAAALDDFYRQHPQYLYTQLLDAGAYPEALKLIKQDDPETIRAGFWRGLASYRSGQLADAARLWKRVAELPVPEDGDVDYLELVLTRYYLGDHDGVGLASVLRAIREDPNFWGLFFLAGLGWAMRNDMVAARTDFQVAVSRRKMLAEGTKLTHHWWSFCTELLDAAKQEQIAEFFEDAQIQRPT